MSDSVRKAGDPTDPLKTRRPLPVKLMMWIIALWTVLGWLRFGRALSEAELMLKLLTEGLYAYLLLAGLIWGCLGLCVLCGLVCRARWARIVLAAAVVLYPALYWTERLIFWRDPNAQRNWPFMLALTMIWFGLGVWGLCAARARAYFDDKNQNE